MQASKRGRREGAENSFFSVASVYDIPVKSGCAGALINIFAPCAEEEYARVLRNGGLLYVVYAGEEHLMGLKRALYDDVYRNDVRADMPERMELVEERRVRFDITLTSSELIEELFTMTPYYWRTSPEDKQKIWGLSQLSCEVDVIIAIYRKSEEKT
jgi:23S rRNA (guanine745-N1)-methyltransferase